MLTRRGLFQVGAALAASSTVFADGRTGGLALTGSTPPFATVIDGHSADARVFGQAAAARGLSVHPIGRDLADVYYGQLAPHWRQYGPASVAGLTGIAPLFYLERLAWDADMRIVLLGRHQIASDARARHALNGPQAVVDAFRASAHWIDWRIALAQTLTRMPAAAPVLKPLSAVRDAAVAGDPALFSWVLAPIVRTARSAHHQVLS